MGGSQGGNFQAGEGGQGTLIQIMNPLISYSSMQSCRKEGRLRGWDRSKN